jgi:hypothetical protein
MACSLPAQVSFAPPVLVPTFGPGEATAPGDFNRDGRVDLAAVTSGCCKGRYESSVFIFFQQPDGSLGNRLQLYAGWSLTSLGVGDVTGDALDDVVVLNGPRSIGVFAQDPGGGFRPPVTYPVPDGQGEVRVGDLNHDGRGDVVTVSPEGILVLLQGPTGVLAPPVFHPVLNARPIALADVNGDGWTDVLLLGHNPCCGLSVLRQNAGGGLDAPRFYEDGLNGPVYCVAAGDVNGDGRTDVLLGGYTGLNDPRLAIFLQNPDGSLAPATHVVPFAIPRSLSVADVSGDGLHDVVAVHNGEGITAHEQDPGGTLQPFVRLIMTGGGAGPQMLTVADLSGDGLNDIAVIGIQLLRHQPLTLAVERGALPVSTPSRTRLFLNSPPDAGRPYLLLPGLSGTSPGVVIEGVPVPLNPDALTLAFLSGPMLPWFQSFAGTLDARGHAEAALDTLAPLDPAAIGVRLFFAWVVHSPIVRASQPRSVVFVP